MALSREEVRHIADLARLDLTPAEEQLFADQLGKIVDYFDQLRESDLAGVPAAGAPAAVPPAQDPPPCAGGTTEADDRESPCLPRDIFLENAPESLESFLLVPRIKVSKT